MARLSAADAKRLRISLKASVANGKLPKAAAKKPRGRNRIPVIRTNEPLCDFSLDLPYDPKPKERPRTVSDISAIVSAFNQAKGDLGAFKALLGNGKSRTFTPKNTADYEELISLTAKSAMRGRKPMECAVSVTMVFTLSGDIREWPTSNADGDVDNMAKAVLDGLNGVVFADDRQVVETLCRKRCGEKPGLRVVVKEAELDRDAKAICACPGPTTV